jgi:peptidoglycan pentaglycine glycine transferase (the first glycine)
MVAMIGSLTAPVVAVGAAPPQEWNDFVTHHAHGHFMQLWEWGEVRSTTGWKPHYLAVEGPAGFEATALVLERPISRVGSLFYTPRGPLWKDTGPEGLRSLAAAVRQLARSRGGVLWRIDPYIAESEVSSRPNLEATGFRALDMAWSYWNQPRYVMLLSLEGGKDAVFNAMNKKDRYEIRSAAKQGVAIERPEIRESNIEEFYRLMKVTARKKAIAVRDLDWYARVLRVFGAAGHAALFLARRGRDLVSAGMSIRMGTRAWLMYLGSDYSSSRASWALQWDMVSWAVESGCSKYDFRGTATNYPPRPNDKGYGVYQFKKSFGAQVVPLLGYFDLVLAPARYRALLYAEHHLLPLGERALEILAALRKLRQRAIRGS